MRHLIHFLVSADECFHPERVGRHILSKRVRFQVLWWPSIGALTNAFRDPRIPTSVSFKEPMKIKDDGCKKRSLYPYILRD